MNYASNNMIYVNFNCTLLINCIRSILVCVIRHKMKERWSVVFLFVCINVNWQEGKCSINITNTR